MCVRLVLVLCCVQSWAQRDPTLSRGFQNRDENPRIHPQGKLLPLDQFSSLTDVSEHPDMLAPPVYEPWPRPIIVQSPGFPNIPENTGMPPEERPRPIGQSSDIPGMQEHPQGRPPLLSPAPGTPAFPGRPEKHPDKMQSPLATMDSDNADKRQAQPADPPSNLTVVALPLQNSDHELQLNVSWVPSSGVPANGYSLDVKSVTDTSDCKSLLCYKPSIPNNATWVLVPEIWNTVHGTPCAIRPGCAYLVTLQADPWDGKTTVNLTKKLGECEAGVCSCAHFPRLPVPVVYTERVIFSNTSANVSWTLPTPSDPRRLPAKLRKQSYIVSLYKQFMPTPAANKTIFTRQQIPVQVNTSGLVFEGDTLHWKIIPIPLELPLLAKVQLVDERGCVGPAGNATVFDPVEDVKPPSNSKLSLGVYATLGALIGAWAMGAVFVLSARVVKRVLKSFRPAPVSAPLEPLRRRPAWFPLQLRT